MTDDLENRQARVCALLEHRAELVVRLHELRTEISRVDLDIVKAGGIPLLSESETPYGGIVSGPIGGTIGGTIGTTDE